jgi:hypothetical protein
LTSEPAGHRGLIELRLNASSCTRATSHKTRGNFQVNAAEHQLVDLRRAIEIALAEPVRDHGPAERARDQVRTRGVA